MDIPEHNSLDALFEPLVDERRLIARGSSRDVYEIEGHPGKVLKVSRSEGNFTNWTEIVVHQAAEESGKLAAVYCWSWSGKFLVMERLQPLEEADLLLYQYPEFITDRKPENLGRAADGSLRVLDYGMLVFRNQKRSDFA